MKKYKCLNIGNCDNANKDKIFEIAEGEKTECPVCHKDDMLVEVKGPNKKLIGIIVGAMLGIAAIGGAIYAFTRGEDGKGKGKLELTLNHSEKTLKVGDSDTIIATVTPEGTQATFTWKASKDGTIEVQDGIVKAVKGGSGKVRVQAIVGKETLSAICKYTVEPTENPKLITALTIEGGNFNLKKGNSKRLTYKAEPADNEESVSWKSSDESVAIVSNAGEVNALKEGKATISVVSDKSNKQADVVVTVVTVGTVTDDGGTGSFTLSYGKYTGQMKNGYPNGQGRLVYTKSRQINRNDPKGRMANPGDVVQGTFVNGFFTIGKHYDANGNLIESLNVGSPVEGVFESK